MKKNFILCGLTGWCLEIFWTGLHAFLQGETTMIGKTSLLMFPIYGCASVIPIVYQRISRIPTACRGLVYTAGIFFTEFTSGSILKHFHMCPWNYNDAPLQYKGLIRLDYAPLWFITGLLFEKILTKAS